jgi:NADH-quinone oxidoreductase subunit M
MIPVLLIAIPLVAGILSFFFKEEKAVRGWALLAALVTLAVSAAGIFLFNDPQDLRFSTPWLGSLNSSFSVKLDGMGQLLCLLTAISYPVIFLSTWKTKYHDVHQFFGLMLLGQAGLMGVFLSMDALLFYFFWELALIPMYFLCSKWGGERRIQVTFKFFIYTFVGSLLMLIGILMIYANTPDRSFAIESFYRSVLSYKQQDLIFWLLFIAFAIKMPVFPFHTWQPDTYEQAPTSTTMVLSGVMVKMGVFAVIRWVLPVTPVAVFQRGDIVMTLSIVGMIYASLIAIRQNDLKRLVAYSSIAHIGLMAAAIFAENKLSLQGVMIQMFNHGINIIGLWVIVEWIERQFGTRKISDLGGIALRAPVMAIMVVVISLANIALPLTNAFVGEFMMFSGIFTSQFTQYYLWFTVFAGISIILAAVYTLNMIRKAWYGEASEITRNAVVTDAGWNEKIALGVIVGLIFWLGVYPQCLLGITDEISTYILNKADISHLLKK